MGTRSLIIMRVKQRNGTFKPWFILYQQFDGYPSWVGKKLCEFLKGIKLVNGIPVDNSGIRYANGAACLFAQVIGHIKDGKAGGAYLHPAEDDHTSMMQDFNYYLDVDEETKTITFGCDDVFRGNVDDGLKWCVGELKIDEGVKFSNAELSKEAPKEADAEMSEESNSKEPNVAESSEEAPKENAKKRQRQNASE